MKVNCLQMGCNIAFANLGGGDLRIYSNEKENGFIASQILDTHAVQDYQVNIGKSEY